jgi:hypothetical protein
MLSCSPVLKVHPVLWTMRFFAWQAARSVVKAVGGKWVKASNRDVRICAPAQFSFHNPSSKDVFEQISRG